MRGWFNYTLVCYILFIYLSKSIVYTAFIFTNFSLSTPLPSTTLSFKRTTDNSLQETVLSRRRPDLLMNLKRMRRNNQHDNFDDEIEILSEDMKLSSSINNISNDTMEQMELNNINDIYPTTMIFEDNLENKSLNKILLTKVNLSDIEMVNMTQVNTFPTSMINLIQTSKIISNNLLFDNETKFDTNITISDNSMLNDNYTNNFITSNSPLSFINDILSLNNTEFDDVKNITVDSFLKKIIYEEDPKHISAVNETTDVNETTNALDGSLTTINVIQFDNNDLISTASLNTDVLTNEISSTINDENTVDMNVNKLDNQTVLSDNVTTISVEVDNEETDSPSNEKHTTEMFDSKNDTLSTEEHSTIESIIIDSSPSEQNTIETTSSFTSELLTVTDKSVSSMEDNNTEIDQWDNVTSKTIPSLSDENSTLSDYADNETTLAYTQFTSLINDTSVSCENDEGCLTLDVATTYSSDGNVTIHDETMLDKNDLSNENETESNTTRIDLTTWTYDNETTETISDYSYNNISHTDVTILLNETQNENGTNFEYLTSTEYFDDDFNSTNETDQIETTATLSLIKTTEIVQCDLTCQCTKKCSYGFDLINETCECSPPCAKYQCFDNHTCEVNRAGEPICQPFKKPDRPLLCHQPMHVGHHESVPRYHDRWYYHPIEQTCHHFIYRGSGGNENNFRTLNDCRLECIMCASTPDRGSCNGFIQMWYYDYNKQKCLPFIHSGCKGNDNKFIRETDCIDTCVTRINTVK
ncbi:unnamed protein product [Didymodactylos carnosus]|uniref:BPTI/Kunitz inhibitor domain-containing protein n=1 Tax=Didymodactylos carnosus TaxID=1234261 RepID=A0A813ZEH0_9BILA|nr:unnamed protein product [Didymodactylos carnosus]CAF3680219.1 unnamed protein product [Didymodactylos carnosus]